MKSRLGQVASKSTETVEMAAYSKVASEYYDARLHPTCADFRAASLSYLKRLFREEAPSGAIADIGCGESLIVDLTGEKLVLVDESEEMLNRNAGDYEKRRFNVTKERFGESEFDWIFAILGDPYNIASTWENIEIALKRYGTCIFITPSFVWSEKFRNKSVAERRGFARFDLLDGSSAFLPSVILPEPEQRRLIESSHLILERYESIRVGTLERVNSDKIRKYLKPLDSIIEIYRVRKP